MDSLYNMVINTLNRSAAALNGLYHALHENIQQKTDQATLGRADQLTGNRLSRTRIESFLEENRRYLANSYQGLAIVQTAQQDTARIQEKIEAMKGLAQQADSGLHSAEEIQDFQARFEALIIEIDRIAVRTRPGGFAMLSSTAFGAVGIQIDRDQKLEIDSMDMTAAGLGIIYTMDLIGNPKEALAGVQMALDEVAAYAQHLEETKSTLAATLDILNEEREALLPALACVRESQAALRAVEALAGMMRSTEALVLAVQARIESDRAIRLMLEETDSCSL